MHSNRDELQYDVRMRDVVVPMLGAVAVYAVLRIAQTALFARAFVSFPGTTLHHVTLAILDGAVLSATFPLAVLASRRFPVDRAHLPNVAVHLACGFVFTAVWMLVLGSVGSALTGAPTGRTFAQDYVVWIPGGLAAYTVIVTLVHAIIASRRAHAQQLRASRLDAQLTAARLETLKTQLEPHFLFNTLHTVSELVHIDPAAADTMITALGQLLRRTLDASMLHEVTIGDEIDYVGAYLDIHRVRHGERLRVTYDIPEDLRGTAIPPLILQPLVENALRHGIAPSPGGGTITIRAREANGVLKLSVADDGVGPGSSVR
ncbi:MAG TPA: histidine kinase, partial [Gemmatimonadaceae bacterium]|nr:histidine kinase [Gemmatimonadaceae bacterium]